MARGPARLIHFDSGLEGAATGRDLSALLGQAQAYFPPRSWCEEVRLCPSEDRTIRWVRTRLPIPGVSPEGQLAGQRLLLGAAGASRGLPSCWLPEDLQALSGFG